MHMLIKLLMTMRYMRNMCALCIDITITSELGVIIYCLLLINEVNALDKFKFHSIACAE